VSQPQRESDTVPAPLTESGLDRITAMNHLLKLTNRLMAPFSIHLEKRYKISLNEFRVLMVIGQRGVTASHELAQILGVNTMAVSRAVAALHRHGRIDVATDPLSRRRKTLRLTPEGERLWREMMPASVKVADYLFEALCPEEVLAFDQHVQTLTDRLEAQDMRGRSVFLERTRPGEEPA
jgi:DNA-binding MarR family transcriptional regulator